MRTLVVANGGTPDAELLFETKGDVEITDADLNSLSRLQDHSFDLVLVQENASSQATEKSLAQELHRLQTVDGMTKTYSVEQIEQLRHSRETEYLALKENRARVARVENAVRRRDAIEQEHELRRRKAQLKQDAEAARAAEKKAKAKKKAPVTGMARYKAGIKRRAKKLLNR